MEIEVKKDLSVLTNIPERYYDKIENNLKYIIIDGISDAMVANENTVEFKSDIGSLLVGVEDNVVKYKFTPSETFENDLKSKVKYGQNLLKDKLEDSLIERITSLYKDLF